MKRRKERQSIQTLMNKHLARENAKYSAQFVEIPPEHWPQNTVSEKQKPQRAWRNRDYLALVYGELDGIFRISICRTAVNLQARWVDGIDWQALQEIKNAIGFGHLDAVEVYPKNSDIVNDANMRHLWVLPEPLPFAWRRS